MIRAAASLVAVTALAACVSGRDCVNAIPADLRADAIRAAVEKDLVPRDLVPRDDMSLALGRGRPYADLPDARRDEIARWVAGYAACLRERINR